MLSHISKKSVVKTSFILALFVGLAFGLLYFMPENQVKGAGSWWNTSFDYRKTINISNSDSYNYNNVSVTFWFNHGGKANSDCSDIRIADESANTNQFGLRNCNSTHVEIVMRVNVNAKYDENAIDENSKDFLEFTKYTLIHTLAHLFYLYLVTTKVPIDPEKIVYYINNSTIFILENSKNNGMGLVETIKKEIKEVGEWRFLKEFIEWSLENFLLPHHRDFERKQKELKKEAENALRELSNLKIFKEIRKLQEKIKELNEELKSRVDLAHIDLITYRHLLTWKLQEEYDEDLSEYLLTLVNAEGIPKLCSDGCNECLIFYRNCSEPFLQNYTISKLLVLEFLRTLRRGNVSVVGKGLGKSIEKLMEGAEKIILKVPFIDEFGYSFLKRLKQKDKEIIVISQNKDMLSKLSKEGIKTFQLKGFHAKIYYLESKENKILLQGSVNLTYRGFYENEENISIIWEPSTVLRIEKELRKYE